VRRATVRVFTNRLVPCRIRIGPLGPYPALKDEDESPTVLFIFPTAQRIARDWEQMAFEGETEPRVTEYDAKADAFRFYDPVTSEWYVWRGRRYGAATLYPIGEGVWAL
jgi:hypothetical protein